MCVAWASGGPRVRCASSLRTENWELPIWTSNIALHRTDGQLGTHEKNRVWRTCNVHHTGRDVTICVHARRFLFGGVQGELHTEVVVVVVEKC